MQFAIPPVVIQKLNVFAAARIAGEGARHGRVFERAFAAGRYGTAISAARRARALARTHQSAGHAALYSARAEGVHRVARSNFREGFVNSRGVSNRLVVRTALSRRLPVPIGMRAGFIAGAARNRLIRVRDPGVRGGSYVRRVPA